MLVEVWADFEQAIVDKATDHWRKRQWACVKAKRQHFETCCGVWHSTFFKHTVLNDYCFSHSSSKLLAIATVMVPGYEHRKFVRLVNLIKNKIKILYSKYYWYESSFDKLCQKITGVWVFWDTVYSSLVSDIIVYKWATSRIYRKPLSYWIIYHWLWQNKM